MAETMTKNELVQKIHNDFFACHDEIFNFKEYKIDPKLIEKSERLKNLGFTNAAPLQELRQENKLLSENQKLMDLRDFAFKFNCKYPFKKIISLSQIKELCKKYNLILGNINHFEADIPEKNLIEIEKFMQTFDRYDLGMKKIIDINYSRHIFGSWESYRYEPGEMQIIAPQTDFNSWYINSTKIEDGVATELNVVYPEDPIVVLPLRTSDDKEAELYLIVTAWGIEAQDELVINHKLN